MTTQQKLLSLSKTSVHLKPIVLANESKTVGAIVNLEGALTQRTVLDKEFQENGGIINFSPHSITDNWGRTVTGITIPPLPVTYQMSKAVAVLHPIAVKANTVTRVLEAIHNNEQNISVLARAVRRYNIEISKTIFGKSGVFNKNILGPRIKRSFRAVIIPGIYDQDIFGESYEWIGIPQRIFRSLKMSTGDTVIIGRDPTIWLGSLEILRAYETFHDAMEIHPLLLPQLAGDHDGDQCWGYYPDNDDYAHAVADFLRKHTKWSKNFCEINPDTNVDWSDFRNDQENRLQVTGLSVSPLDILNNTTDVQKIFSYCSGGKRTRGKFDIDELLEACRQVPIDKWKDIAEMVNQAQLAMKVYMGPIGLVTLRLINIGHMNKELEPSAHYLGERCAQALLDSKHLTYEQLRHYEPAKIFEILNLKNSYIQTADDMYQALKPIINCDETALPILRCIAVDGRGLAKMSQQDYSLFEGITFTASSDKNGYMPKWILDSNIELPDEGLFSNAFKFGLNNDD
jgi:hypothetical protein